MGKYWNKAAKQTPPPKFKIKIKAKTNNIKTRQLFMYNTYISMVNVQIGLINSTEYRIQQQLCTCTALIFKSPSPTAFYMVKCYKDSTCISNLSSSTNEQTVKILDFTQLFVLLFSNTRRNWISLTIITTGISPLSYLQNVCTLKKLSSVRSYGGQRIKCLSVYIWNIL